MEGVAAGVRRWGLTVVLAVALAAAVLHSLWAPGYLLLVDAVFGPLPAPVRADFSAPVGLVQAGATLVAGGEWGGRLVFLGSLTLCLVAPMVLLRAAPWYARVMAGLLATLNPWVYARIVEGQWGVVDAAAMLFLCIDAGRGLAARPGPRSAAYLAAATCGTVAFDPHFGGMLAVLAVLAGAWTRPWRQARWLPWFAVAIAPLAALAALAALPFFGGGGHSSYASVVAFGRADFEVFRASSDPVFGLLPGLLGLQGFWAERLGRFPAAMAGAPWWPLSWAVIVASAVAGAVLRRANAWVLVAGIVGLAVSASTALPGGVAAAAWLASRVPLVGVYREPQKWSALWLVALVILSADAVEALRRRRGGRLFPSGRAAAPALAYLLVLSTLLPGGLGIVAGLPTVLRPAEYPADWGTADTFLTANVSPGSLVVVLPWHAYERLGFVDGRVVSNPAAVVFTGRLLVPDDLEIPGRLTDDPGSLDLATASVGTEGAACALADAVRARGASWVVVEPTEGDTADRRRLQACGFIPVVGGEGRVTVLRG